MRGPPASLARGARDVVIEFFRAAGSASRKTWNASMCVGAACQTLSKNHISLDGVSSLPRRLAGNHHPSSVSLLRAIETAKLPRVYSLCRPPTSLSRTEAQMLQPQSTSLPPTSSIKRGLTFLDLSSRSFIDHMKPLTFTKYPLHTLKRCIGGCP